MNKKIIYLLALLPIILFAGCTKSNPTTPNNVVTTVPKIVSLTAPKDSILYGGSESADITCVATGGNLKYVWHVDLGDIIPLNGDHSMISFTGAACCVGPKTITCTVSNDSGTVSKDIIITILENSTFPNIVNLFSDKTDLHVSSKETAKIECVAQGGFLKYTWSVDKGSLVPDPKDSTIVNYTPDASCIGTRTIKCSVKNSKGSALDSLQVNVVN